MHRRPIGLLLAAALLGAPACGDDSGSTVRPENTFDSTHPVPSGPSHISLASARAGWPVTSSVPRPPPPPPLTPAPPLDLCSLPSGPLPIDLSLPQPEVTTLPPSTLGLTGFTANARVQPRGAAGATYYFEYGETTAYGSKTSTKTLGPKLAAVYSESWNSGLGGWRGGSGTDLVHHAGGFARYSEPTGTDYNHVDGIGFLHLVQYFYPGYFDADAPTAALGGSDPDLRDAKVEVTVRGNQWRPRTSELLFWAQGDTTHGKPPPDRDPTYTNWAHAGHTLTESLLDGAFHTVSYRLDNDTNAWTFAGGNVELHRVEYVYSPLDDVLRHVDIDFFHLLAFIDDYDSPTGSIDFDDFRLTYRNHSLLFPSNGARLVAAPASADDPGALTDGARNGAGKMWRSTPAAAGPHEIVYAFERPVTIDRVQLHQHTEWPTKRVEVLVTRDGAKWTPLFAATMPETALAGPSFAYLLAKDANTCAIAMKVRLVDGYRAESWGLGEIEAFGSGAVMKTDDDWYGVNADITGLVPGKTYHYRVVATATGAALGPDMVYEVPSTTKPRATTLAATRVRAGAAKLEGRINTLGVAAEHWFEWGADTSYGFATTRRHTGPEITDRPAVGLLENLVPGSTVHYRLVVAGLGGTTYGTDSSFVAR